MTAPLVIVGKGMAATRLVDELAQGGLGRHAVAVIGDEPRLAYNRVLLSCVLAGEMAAPEADLKPAGWWRDRGVTTLYGRPVTGIDRMAKTVTLAGGPALPYAKLVLATGSQPLRLPLPGADLPGVIAFRTHDDVAALQAAGAREERAVVIGGGLLGIEAAYGLARCGAKVTLVHLMDRLMERQLDQVSGAMLADAIRAKGIEVVLNAQTKAIEGEGCVERVVLGDGTVIPAEMVVMAAGIRPNVALAKDAGLAVNRGIVVDDRLGTDDPDIFALGECAEHRGIPYGLVEPAYEQAKVLAATLNGKTASYAGSVVFTNLKVSGVGVFSAGDFMGGDGTQVILMRDRARGTYRKLVVRDDRLVGAVLFGDTGHALWFRDLIRAGTSIAPFRDTLMFGEAMSLPKAA